jgi:hypothetical protein
VIDPAAFTRTAVDGAVVTVDPDRHGFAVNCTDCGYVCSDPADEPWVREQAEIHEGWHEAGYEHAADTR